MDRCEYCAYRNSWDCGDEWDRVPNNRICNEFSLDFGSLNDKQKKAIQKNLMNNTVSIND